MGKLGVLILGFLVLTACGQSGPNACGYNRNIYSTWVSSKGRLLSIETIRSTGSFSVQFTNNSSCTVYGYITPVSNDCEGNLFVQRAVANGNTDVACEPLGKNGAWSYKITSSGLHFCNVDFEDCDYK